MSSRISNAVKWAIVVVVVLACCTSNHHHQAFSQFAGLEEFDIDAFLDSPKQPEHPLENIQKVPHLDGRSLIEMQSARRMDFIMMLGRKPSEPGRQGHQLLTAEVFWARIYTYVGRGWKLECGGNAINTGEEGQICGYFTSIFRNIRTSPAFIKWNGSQFELYNGEQSYHAVLEWLHYLPGGTDIFKTNVLHNTDSAVLEPQMTRDKGDELAELIDMVQKASPRAQFVEWGSGGSTHTVATLLRGNQTYFSIEHVGTWYERVKNGLPPSPDQAKVAMHFIPPVIPEFEFEESVLRPNGHSREELPLGLDEYIHLNSVPELDWDAVQGAFIDGIARGAVLMMLAANLNEGTTVLLHDYVGRNSSYDWALHGYKKIKTVYEMLVLEVKPRKCKATP